MADQEADEGVGHRVLCWIAIIQNDFPILVSSASEGTLQTFNKRSSERVSTTRLATHGTALAGEDVLSAITC